MRQQVKDSYHHGNLREALLSAAEDELVEKGRERFSLRNAAKRAGVSHAAPVHHFGGAEGLLAALIKVGFDRMEAGIRTLLEESTEPRERLIATGLGYVEFAVGNPALFRLMFSAKPDQPADSCELPPGAGPYGLLQECLIAVTGPTEELTMLRDIAVAWGIVHGLSNLLIEKAPLIPPGLDDDERLAWLADILAQTLPRRR